MAYCGPRGIPLSAFLEWPEWDQDAALGWQAHESRRCGSCGTHPDDWNPKRDGDREAYHAEDVQCPGCRETQAYSAHPEVTLRAESVRGMHIRLAPGSRKSCPHC